MNSARYTCTCPLLGRMSISPGPSMKSRLLLERRQSYTSTIITQRAYCNTNRQPVRVMQPFHHTHSIGSTNYSITATTQHVSSSYALYLGYIRRYLIHNWLVFLSSWLYWRTVISERKHFSTHNNVQSL